MTITKEKVVKGRSEYTKPYLAGSSRKQWTQKAWRPVRSNSLRVNTNSHNKSTCRNTRPLISGKPCASILTWLYNHTCHTLTCFLVQCQTYEQWAQANSNWLTGNDMNTMLIYQQVTYIHAGLFTINSTKHGIWTSNRRQDSHMKCS